MEDKPKKIIQAVFFKTEIGNEPVRDWLKDQKKEDKSAIGKDIKEVEFGWPKGKPLVTKMDKDLWEVRSDISDSRIARVLFTVYQEVMVLLHGFIKKSQKTPKPDLDLAKNRRDDVHR
ncbi:Phage-related protein [Amphritea atlantica]|uniref:Phage-related protein n=1 Tax=Amphritea atlantica TaxID=355243 RepID=A0A1H9DCW3_9GAMM|nr:type II toxin-antitoxin system RelE/ParE family toxin [Amphritea atlantica]SEQ10558.1 Phage-related protein [Amphritea atlantica]